MEEEEKFFSAISSAIREIREKRELSAEEEEFVLKIERLLEIAKLLKEIEERGTFGCYRGS